MEGWNAHLDGQLDEDLFSVQVQWTCIQKTFLLIYIENKYSRRLYIYIYIYIQYTCTDCMHSIP